MSLRRAKHESHKTERDRRPAGNNIKNTTNLNRETGKYEAVLGGMYWHEKYSKDLIIQPCPEHPKGFRHDKLIVYKILANGIVYIWTEGLKKLGKEPIINEQNHLGCHNVAVMSQHYLTEPVVEWVFDVDRRI